MFGQRTNAPAAPAAPARSKYGGITCSDTRDPMLEEGTYRVRVTGAVEGYNPGKRRASYKVSLQVLEAADGSKTAKGSTVTMVCFETDAGLGDLKRFAVHAAGFGPALADREAGVDVRAKLIEGERAFDALDESFGRSGAILEATFGVASPAPSLVGRIVDVIVSLGKPVINPQTSQPTGDHYRVYSWGVVPEAEQHA